MRPKKLFPLDYNVKTNVLCTVKRTPTTSKKVGFCTFYRLFSCHRVFLCSKSLNWLKSNFGMLRQCTSSKTWAAIIHSGSCSINPSINETKLGFETCCSLCGTCSTVSKLLLYRKKELTNIF